MASNYPAYGNPRLRITHILPSLGRIPRSTTEDGAGGLSSGTLSLARAQQRAGHKVSILSWTPTRTCAYQTEEGVKIGYATSWGWARFGRWDLRWILPAFVKTFHSVPTILHAHSDPNLLLLSWAKSRVFHIRTPVPENPPAVYARLIARADAVVCNSRFTARSFLAAVEYPAEKVFVVHNGADDDFFNPAAKDVAEIASEWPVEEGEVAVVFAGALVEEKGALDAIEALRLIHAEQRVKLKLIMIGGPKLWPTVDSPDGLGEDYEARLRYAARDLPVYFAGVYSRSAMPSALASANIVVVPSLWEEPFGTIVCEAMAAGKPVVAYRSGGIVETIIDGETGLLVPKGDVARLAEAIFTLASDAELCSHLGHSAKQRAREHFTWDKAVGKLNAIYLSILD